MSKMVTVTGAGKYNEIIAERFEKHVDKKELEKAIVSHAMQILGKRTSERKKASSRANAKRPRKRKITKQVIVEYLQNEARDKEIQ